MTTATRPSLLLASFAARKQPEGVVNGGETIALILNYDTVDPASGRPLAAATVDVPEISDKRVALRAERTGSPTGSTRQRHDVHPNNLCSFIAANAVHELQMPSTFTTPHVRILQDLVQAGPPLRWLVVDEMRFDLSDVLGCRLAQLALVLSAQHPSGMPAESA